MSARAIYDPASVSWTGSLAHHPNRPRRSSNGAWDVTDREIQRQRGQSSLACSCPRRYLPSACISVLAAHTVRCVFEIMRDKQNSMRREILQRGKNATGA